MLILGLLASIAIPSFLNQTDKADDAKAKAMARAAQTAIEAFATANDGEYTAATVAALHDIEICFRPGLPLALSNITAETYTVTATSSTETEFSITRDAPGGVDYECNAAGDGGCPAGGDWG